MTENLPDTNVGNIEYIRKADAVDALKAQADTMRKWASRYDEQRRGVLTAVNIVEDIKPADVVQVVHAYWIQTSAEDEDGNAYYSCSNCGSGESHNPIVEVPYCWKCGAKMDAQGEE